MNPKRFNRPFALLEYIAKCPDGDNLAGIAKALGLSPSSAHDLLSVMLENELLRITPDRRYHIGPRMIALALLVVDSVDVRKVSAPYLADLAKETGEDVYLAVRVGDTVVYADKYQGTEPVKVNIKLGQPRPLHSTAVGKLFLAWDPHLQAMVLNQRPLPAMTDKTITDPDRLRAELEQIRASGLSISREENVAGVIALAVPVYNGAGQICGAVSTSSAASRMPDERILEVSVKMKETASKISWALGNRTAGLTQQPAHQNSR